MEGRLATHRRVSPGLCPQLLRTDRKFLKPGTGWGWKPPEQGYAVWRQEDGARP